MGKKLFSLCMALVLCLGLLPVTALAAGSNTVYVGGVALTGSSDSIAYATTNENGEVITEGATADNYNIKWDGATLTLRNATILEAKEYEEKNKEKIAIYLASGNMNLVLVGENTVDALGEGSAASCGINLGNGGLTIRGEEGASLSVFGGDTTNTTNSNSCGIYATGAITIDSGTVTATGESASAASYGICVSGAVTIENGTVNAASGQASGNSVGIYTGNSITINGGDVTATSGEAGGNSYGIHTAAWSTSITVNSGSVNATSGEAQGDSCGIFAESRDYDSIHSSFSITGGSVTATGGDAVGSGYYSCGIKVDGKITISGGTVNATGKRSTKMTSCGIYAIQSVKISGGTVTATGGTSDNEYSSGIFATNFSGYNVEVNISGGTVTATGGAAEKGSYGILTETAKSKEPSTVTINGNSVVRANTTDTEGVDSKPISGIVHDTTFKINKESGIIFENGVGTVYGDVTLREDLTIGANESLTIPQGATLTIPDGVTLTNEGAITNEGALTNNGTITNSGTLTNNGTLTIGQGGSLTGMVAGNQVQYTVTVLTDGSGSASASTTAAEEGEIITLTASPSSGYHFERWEVVSGGVTLTGNQFTMLDQPVTVKAVFEKNPYIPPTYAVTVPDTTGGTVEVSPSRASRGRTVTITAEPDTGYELESLTVLDSRGNEIALTDKGGGKYTFTMPASRVTVEASFTPAPLPFEDVAPGAWYEEAVRYAYFHNIMEGMSKTEFAPTTALTRAMAVQILYNLEGQPDLSSENLGYPYEDVDAQAWYGDAVYWARITGVATGYGDGTFQPGDSITRQEFAQMLYNYAKYKGYDLSAEGDLSQFPDSESVADWAEAAMSWANGNQLINGHDDGTIDAAGIGTRAQAASILMQFDQNLVEN